MRILITGSRDWTDQGRIARTIMRYLAATTEMLYDDDSVPIRRNTNEVVIVHGGARGADQLAATWAEGCEPPIATEAHPVTQQMWQENPRVAGYMRNIDMVAMGADVCLAFISPCHKDGCHRPEPHGSHGASHTADLAESVGIQTIRIT